MIRGALIGLLTLLIALQGLALRAEPFAAPAAGAALELHLCSGAVLSLDLSEGSAPAPAASHAGCLDCCLGAAALPAVVASAPERAAAQRLRRAALVAHLQGRPVPGGRARGPPWVS